MSASSSSSLSRRQLLSAGGLALGTAAVAASLPDVTSAADAKPRPFQPPFCLNTSTIRGQKLGIVKEIEIAAAAGYDGIEPWIRDLQKYVEDGGKADDLRKRIADAGLRVFSAIGFSQWIVDDDTKRAAALEQAKREMDLLHQVGGRFIAAPPSGATGQADLNLFRAAERYRALLEVGRQIGVTPQVEVWGFSKSLSRLGEACFVAIEAGHPDACLLPDVYHIFKGGSDFAGLAMLGPQAMHCFHMNDYPADPPRATISDKDRVHCGDGVAPLTPILHTLRAIGFRGALSLELFNPLYWKQDPLAVAKEGLVKMKSAVETAMAG